MSKKYCIIFLFLSVLYFQTSCTKIEKKEPIPEISLNKNEIERFSIISGPIPGSPGYLRYEAIYKEIFRRMDYELDMVSFPMKRSHIEIQTGEYFGITGLEEHANINKEYRDLIRVDVPVNETTFYAFSLDKNIRIDKWSDLKKDSFNVGHNEGIQIMAANIQENISEENIFKVSDSHQGLRALLSGRIDLYIGGNVTKNRISGKDKNPEFEGIHNAGAIQTLNLYPFIHKNYQYLIQDFTKSFKEMKDDGTYERLSEIYE